jgi:hypothetical protein
VGIFVPAAAATFTQAHVHEDEHAALMRQHTSIRYIRYHISSMSSVIALSIITRVESFASQIHSSNIMHYALRLASIPVPVRVSAPSHILPILTPISAQLPVAFCVLCATAARTLRLAWLGGLRLRSCDLIRRRHATVPTASEGDAEKALSEPNRLRNAQTPQATPPPTGEILYPVPVHAKNQNPPSIPICLQ